MPVTRVAKRLPHTGLHVPHDRVTMSAPGLVAVDGRLVGSVQINQVCAEYLQPIGDPPRLRVAQWHAFVAACRSETGQPVSEEGVLDALRAEHTANLMVRHAAETGCHLLQQMLPAGDGRYFHGDYDPDEPIMVDADASHAALLEVIRATTRSAVVGSWWRSWTGKYWREVTRRPPLYRYPAHPHSVLADALCARSGTLTTSSQPCEHPCDDGCPGTVALLWAADAGITSNIPSAYTYANHRDSTGARCPASCRIAPAGPTHQPCPRRCPAVPVVPMQVTDPDPIGPPAPSKEQICESRR